mgnify:CR=1 FL=1
MPGINDRGNQYGYDFSGNNYGFVSKPVMQPGGYGMSAPNRRYVRPAPSYMEGGMFGRPSYPQWFQPYTPESITNRRDTSQQWKPGPGFQMKTSQDYGLDSGGPGFGVQELIKAILGQNIPETPPIRDPIPGINF